MRVLTVLPDPPLLEGGAAGRCTVGLLRGLQSHGVEVRALAAQRHGYSESRPPADLQVELLVPPERGGWLTRAEMITRPCGNLSRGAFGARVRELAREADVLHLDQVDAGWCDVGVNVPSVVNIHYLIRHDIDGVSYRSREAAAVLVRHLGERGVARRHRFIVANSPLVANDLRELAPDARIVVVPLSVEPAHYRQATLDGPPRAIFIGTGMWRPTRMALRRLVTRVWPLVREQMPDARLEIAGRGTDNIGLKPSPGVEILGEIESAASFLERASVLVYPLDKGSGMKVKVVEALASGVPVVTTPAGAEGIEENDGVVVIPNGEDERFAQATLAILCDELERRQRGTAAREAFLRRHAPAAAAVPLVALYEQMAGGERG